jgi:hypothetical protein
VKSLVDSSESANLLGQFENVDPSFLCSPSCLDRETGQSDYLQSWGVVVLNSETSA